MSKKKQYILIGIGAVVVISLLSSLFGGNNDSEAPKEEKVVVLKAAQTEIKGDLKGCFEVVDKNYKVKFAKKSYDNDIVVVELMRTETELPYDRNNLVIFPEAKESQAEYCAGFGIEILNADGDVIDKKNANATPYSWDEMTAALKILPGETSTIAFHFDNLSEAVSFRITSLIQPNDQKKSEVKKDVESVIDEAIKDADLEQGVEVAGKTMKAAEALIDILK